MCVLFQSPTEDPSCLTCSGDITPSYQLHQPSLSLKTSVEQEQDEEVGKATIGTTTQHILQLQRQL
jgi:hypothetical protein